MIDNSLPVWFKVVLPDGQYSLLETENEAVLELSIYAAMGIDARLEVV